MPIKNRPFFIPKSYKWQPDFYTEIFGNVNAVFTHPTRNITLYLEIRTLGHDYGEPLILCQTEEFRWPVGFIKFRKLGEALNALDRHMSNPDFGKSFKKPLILADTEHLLKFHKSEKTRKIPRRKSNGTKYVLTTEDKRILHAFGYRDNDFDQIEEAINRSTFTLDDSKVINAYDTIALLGKSHFLAGVARSAFHQSSGRVTEDGEHEVQFDSRILFKE